MQRKTTVVSIKKTTGSNSAHRIAETRTRAPVASQRSGDLASSNSSKKAIEESNQLKRAAEDNGRAIKCPEDNRKHSSECSDTDHGQAFEQAQTSMLPGGMGKKRLAYNAVVSAINNKNITNPLPEGSTMPWSIPTPSPASTPQTETLCPATNEHTMMPTAINIVVSGGEETSANERSPDVKVAPTPPVHSPVLPKQAAALRRPLNEALPLVEAVPEWRELVVFNEKHSESNTCSPTLETARKQLEVIKMPSTEGEGQYLERAVAYIRERMNR
ncbi:hypothetical protein AX14_010827, partial [Amanita brunnescens Koide BX004]